jgi:hypothetical protein
MTSPASDSLVRRIVLVPADPRDTDRRDCRRYRLARLRLEGRDVPAAERFAHLKRQYD